MSTTAYEVWLDNGQGGIVIEPKTYHTHTPQQAIEACRANVKPGLLWDYDTFTCVLYPLWWFAKDKKGELFAWKYGDSLTSCRCV